MLIRAFAFACLLCGTLSSAVHRIELKERTDLADGKSFGATGPYERITATVFFRIDPKLEANRAIVDLNLAPKNSAGMVEFSADLYVLKPRDPAKGNGTAIIDIPNRGRVLSITGFNRGTSALDPKSATDIGDGFLMERGFTLASIGWQWDTPGVAGRLGLKAPRLPDTITGLVRAEYVPDKGTDGFWLGDRDHVPYPIADEKDPANKLTVSDGPGRPRREISRDRWQFVDGKSVRIQGGCEPGKVYELVYRATGAVPVGLGFAAVRDMASFLKYGEPTSPLGDQKQFIKRTVAYGVSQTGRFLRHMLYQGFNEDEKGRKSLDGVWAHVAGAGRGGFNHRFAQPSRDAQPLLHYSWPVDMFPFTDTSMRDPITGRTDGLLSHVKQAPKIFYSNGSYEYWGRAASLIHTTPEGTRDVAPDASTRIYLISGGQHSPGSLPLKRTNTLNTENPLDQRAIMRALLMAMNDWIAKGVEPPASAYPKIASGDLVAADRIQYPAGLQAPRLYRIPHVLDYGPEFLSNGVVTIEPPKEGATYKVLLPKTDQYGNEAAGLRMPELEVPLAAYTGWNLRGSAIGSSDRMIAFIGSFAPIKHSYASKEEYSKKIRQATEALVSRRLILSSDIEGVSRRADQLWDAVAARQ